jgi:hypothetical protein
VSEPKPAPADTRVAWLITVAVGWSLLLLILAVVLPIESQSPAAATATSSAAPSFATAPPSFATAPPRFATAPPTLATAPPTLASAPPALAKVETKVAAPASVQPPTVAVPRYSLVRLHGYRVLALVGIPLLLSLMVGLLLYIRRHLPSRTLDWVAWGLAATLLAGAIIGLLIFLVGIFVLPVGALLVVACAVERHRPEEG